jgi:hypothetical protein
MDKACLECWINAVKKDEIISTQESFIEKQNTTITDLSNSLETQKRKTKLGWIVGTSLGSVFGVLSTITIQSALK